MRKQIAILGSTGSIGTQTLEVIRSHPDRFSAVALAARSDVGRLAVQVAEFDPATIVLTEPTAHQRFRTLHPQWADRLLPPAEASLIEVATSAQADLLVNALVGAAGVGPTLAALQAGKSVALANKETLVAAGALVMEAKKRSGAQLLPVDSEHSALFQCLHGRDVKEVDRLILTASRGPFRLSSIAEMQAVTPREALRHPNWDMGGKITIDSATLMNKGLEVIEAHWLFGMPAEAIDVWVHPQSIVHSLVEFCDGSVLAQLGLPDMRLPIQYALTYPERLLGKWPRLDLTTQQNLSFEKPDVARFPSLQLAYEALRIGGTMPAVLNAANEVAVDLFLRKRLSFLGIARLVETVMNEHHPQPVQELADVLTSDAWARRRAREMAATSLSWQIG